MPVKGRVHETLRADKALINLKLTLPVNSIVPVWSVGTTSAYERFESVRVCTKFNVQEESTVQKFNKICILMIKCETTAQE